MKNINLLVFITQLGLSVAVPLGGCLLLSLWLYRRFSLGNWVVVAGVVLGIILAIDGLRVTIKAMTRLSEEKKQEPPAISFNDHD